MKSRFQFLVVGFSILMVLASAVGGIVNFSSLPYWDMWDGLYIFYLKLIDGDQSVWWAQHNEHRILLSRILFLIDIYFFKGLNYFLIFFNYLLVAIAAFIFYLYLNRVTSGGTFSNYEKNIYILLIIGWLFSWSQYQNLIWAFQSQFFLAQLIPLLAFYFLANSSLGSHKNSIFLVALFFGVIAYGTMANGVLTLPLMILLATLIRLGKARIFALILLSFMMLCLYFNNYSSPGNHGSFKQELITHPLGLIHYVLIYIGNSWTFILGSQVGLGSGLIFALLFFLKLVSLLRKQYASPFQWALITFILFVGATALGTAGGRLLFGIEQANSSRYATPSLMAWVALFLLYLDRINYFFRSYNKSFIFIVFILCSCILIKQTKALKVDANNIFDNNITTLAIALGVKDPDYLGRVYPNSELILNVASRLKEINKSVFSLEKNSVVNTSFGKRVELPIATCIGSITSVKKFSDNTNFLRVDGELIYQGNDFDNSDLQFVNMASEVVGIAFTKNQSPQHLKFIGYSEINNPIKFIVMKSTSFNCKIEIKDNLLIPNISNQLPTPIIRKDLIGLNAILTSTNWIGTDYSNSQIDGFYVRGSYITSDTDTANITLKMKRGQGFYYKTGPSSVGQTLYILNSSYKTLILPQVNDWAFLKFDDSSLPNDFSIKISDNGVGFGEWSAIAILDQ